MTLAQWAASKGKNLADVGRELGFDRSLMSRVSTGNRAPSISMRARFVKTYGYEDYLKVFPPDDELNLLIKESQHD